MAATQEESFREIQLSGKQLIFLAMAVIVVLVATFLMGLQVGRGVLAVRGLPGSESTTAAARTEPPPPPPSASQGSTTAPATAGEKLSYAERLGSSEPAPEQLKKPGAPALSETPTPKAESPAPVAAATAKPAAAVPAKPPATTPPAASTPAASPAASASAASTEPPGPGFAIQLAALRERAEADAIVKRLAGKGYPAYVVAPAKGAPEVYRVRVGKFKDRREADTVAARLQKEEQFKPWVVR
jgi:cell division septation protein DedD